jgi:inosose dehydratase
LGNVSRRSGRNRFPDHRLGPFGYLPTNPEQLKDELGKRGLHLTGGTVGTATHRGAEAFEHSRRDAFAVCELLAAIDVHYLVALPEMCTDLHSGALNQPAELTAPQWGDLVDGHSKLGRLVSDEFDVQLGFHPHVDTHVDTQHFIDKSLQDTDPDAVTLCLDTGHVEYCSGDNREIAILTGSATSSSSKSTRPSPRRPAPSESASMRRYSEEPWWNHRWGRRPCSPCSTTSPR